MDYQDKTARVNKKGARHVKIFYLRLMYTCETSSSGHFNSNLSHTGCSVYVSELCAKWCILVLTVLNPIMAPSQIYSSTHAYRLVYHLIRGSYHCRIIGHSALTISLKKYIFWTEGNHITWQEMEVRSCYTQMKYYSQIVN